jgi:hypothetical protein
MLCVCPLPRNSETTSFKSANSLDNLAVCRPSLTCSCRWGRGRRRWWRGSTSAATFAGGQADHAASTVVVSPAGSSSTVASPSTAGCLHDTHSCSSTRQGYNSGTGQRYKAVVQGSGTRQGQEGQEGSTSNVRGKLVGSEGVLQCLDKDNRCVVGLIRVRPAVLAAVREATSVG